ncbi:MAG: DNA mismatch endonuclease Vsr [Desulfomonilaceae bacterium]
MRRVHSRDTTPEKIFRKALWKNGVRYRTCSNDLPGKPDIVIRSRKLAIFVDGDFWHGGQWARRHLSSLESQFTQSKSRDYWLAKIRKNIERDCHSTADLLSQGWTVLRFWESEIKRNLGRCVSLAVEVYKNGAKPNAYSFAPQKTVAEFFAGIGLIRLALERRGWKIVYANDRDLAKRDMYLGHFQEEPHLFDCEDIHRISAGTIPQVSLATASFPCNDISLAGSRSGLKGRESSAFWGFIRIVHEMGDRRPPLILLENVVGFMSSNKGEDLRAALLALNRLGYFVDMFVVDASWFVPQSRQRLFVIGQIHNESFNCEDKIGSNIAEDRFRPKKLIKFIHNNNDILWSIGSLPDVEPSKSRLADVVEDLPDNAPEWWSQRRTDYLVSQMNPKHKSLVIEMVSGDKWSYGTVFRRTRTGKSMAEIRIDGIAGCLRTPRGGSARQILFKAGHGKFVARLLTPLECARLMGVDDYNFSVSKNKALFGFGDAVCVPAIEWIATHRLNPLVTEMIRGCPLSLK